MKITLGPFSGENPRLAAHLLSDTEAQLASDARVEKGDLRAWHAPKKITGVAGSTIQSLYQHTENGNDHWVTFAEDCDFVKSPVAGDAYERVYFTGKGQLRYFANDVVSDPFDPETDYVLAGIPAPTAPPAFVSGHTGGELYRAYVYTYVDRYGAEGAPSDPLETTTYDTGDVVLGIFTAPPANHAVTTIRIYRTATGASGNADFQYVGELAVGTATFTDSVADEDLGEVIPSELYAAPPDGLKGLIMLPSGCMAGFVGNEVYMSEPYLPHTWSSVNSVDGTIIGLGLFDTNLVVLTNQHPYIMAGVTPEQTTGQKLPGFYPCTSKRGIVSTQHGVLYPSNEGFVMVNYDGAHLVTEKWLTPGDWQTYHPSTVHGEFHFGKYIGWYSSGGEKGGFIIDFTSSLFLSLRIHARAGYVSPGDGHYYIVAEEAVDLDDHPGAIPLAIHLWEGDPFNYLYFHWRSKLFLLDAGANWSCARVVIDREFYDSVLADMADDAYLAGLNAATYAAGDIGGSVGDDSLNNFSVNGDALRSIRGVKIDPNVTFKLFIDRDLAFTKIVTNDRLFRLPSGYRSSKVEMQIEGSIPVRTVELATSAAEMQR